MKTAPDATTKTTLPCAVFVAFFCLLAALHGAGAGRAQTGEEVMDTAQTPGGELSLVRRREPEGTVTVVIKLGDKVVAEKTASREGDAYEGASFAGLYPQGSPRYALVGLSTGALVCGAKFTIVDLSRGKATEDFGNCSDAPRVSYRRDALTVTFPAGPRKHDPGTHYVGPGQVWSYGNGRLRLVGGRRRS
ncbi:MAG TPA: hypothetical protein VGX48_11150 [Pyrinomonadaceae bacterium]|jgi:hypothetical protein|nr:hypothetical protein [Pyrinomonadaceae bacterium]